MERANPEPQNFLFLNTKFSEISKQHNFQQCLTAVIILHTGAKALFLEIGTPVTWIMPNRS